MNEISFKGTIYDISVDHSPIKKDVLNIHKYVIKKKNLK